MDTERYSTIRLGNNHKVHSFDHGDDRVLCGVNRWYHTPFKINKTVWDLNTMLKKYKGYIKRRGGHNPYKFTCKRCEKILETLKKDVNRHKLVK